MVAATERHKMMGKPRYSSSDPSSASGGLLSSTVSSQQDRQARDQQRITVMLISVVVVFLLCQLPQAVQHIYIVYYIIIGKDRTLYQAQVLRITGNVFNLLVMVNCSANFILYSAFSTKFRATFSRLFCRCRCCSPKSYRPESGRDVTESSVTGRYTVLQSNNGPGQRRPRLSYAANGPATARIMRSDALQQQQQYGDRRRSTASTMISDQTPTSGHGGVPTVPPCKPKATLSDVSGEADLYIDLLSDGTSRVDRHIAGPDRLVTHL